MKEKAVWISAVCFVAGLVAMLVLTAACTFKIEPIVEVTDASINFGPIYVNWDSGQQQ